MNKDICCQKFNPKPRDNNTFTWKNKKFIKDKVFTVFYIPINFGSAMVRFNKRIADAKAKVPDELCLSEHTSKWNMNLYLAVDKNIPNAENITLSGTFFSKVYDGDFKDMGKWMENFKEYSKKKKFNIKKTYTWYTTCPKCAKKYGKNYVVIIGKL
ncbi:MAG: hydrolase [Candidatus Woesearchaeota archaeon]